MRMQLELGLSRPSVFSLCESYPLPQVRLELAANLGGRILPIVGDSNMGAEILLRECRESAADLNWNCLSVKISPSGLPCRSAVEAIAEKVGCYMTGSVNLFGSLAEKILAANYRLIIIEGASNLSEAGIWELVKFLEEISAPGKENGTQRLIVWHTLPNWEQVFRGRDTPRQYFFGNVVLQPIARETSAQDIEMVFPELGQLLKASKPAHNRVFEKTGGRIGLWAQLESALSVPEKNPLAKNGAGETLDQLLNVIVGVEAQDGTVKTRPSKSPRCAKIPKGESKYNSKKAASTQRNHRGKRRKPRN